MELKAYISSNRVAPSLRTLNMIGEFVVISVFGMYFAGLSTCLFSIFPTRERIIGIGRAITIPLFSASGLIYSMLAMMPGWLSAIGMINRLYYVAADFTRVLLGSSDVTSIPIYAFAIALAGAVLVRSFTFRSNQTFLCNTSLEFTPFLLRPHLR
jgi:hypothetical protein